MPHPLPHPQDEEDCPEDEPTPGPSEEPSADPTPDPTPDTTTTPEPAPKPVPDAGVEPTWPGPDKGTTDPGYVQPAANTHTVTGDAPQLAQTGSEGINPLYAVFAAAAVAVGAGAAMTARRRSQG